jgi:hypothetical protein
MHPPGAVVISNENILNVIGAKACDNALTREDE